MTGSERFLRRIPLKIEAGTCGGGAQINEGRNARGSRSSTGRATVMLVVVTFLWGFSFPLVKNWMNAARATNCPGGEPVATFTLLGVRTGLALILLAVFQPA